jgi:hypothetical protein
MANLPPSVRDAPADPHLPTLFFTFRAKPDPKISPGMQLRVDRFPTSM